MTKSPRTGTRTLEAVALKPPHFVDVKGVKIPHLVIVNKGFKEQRLPCTPAVFMRVKPKKMDAGLDMKVDHAFVLHLTGDLVTSIDCYPNWEVAHRMTPSSEVESAEDGNMTPLRKKVVISITENGDLTVRFKASTVSEARLRQLMRALDALEEILPQQRILDFVVSQVSGNQVEFENAEEADLNEETSAQQYAMAMAAA